MLWRRSSSVMHSAFMHWRLMLYQPAALLCFNKHSSVLSPCPVLVSVPALQFLCLLEMAVAVHRRHIDQQAGGKATQKELAWVYLVSRSQL